MSGDAGFSIEGLSFEEGGTVEVRFEIALFDEPQSITVSGVRVGIDNDGRLDIAAAVREAMLQVADQFRKLHAEAQELAGYPDRWFPSSS